MQADEQLAAIILAGGRAKRLGGLDKPSVTVGDATLLEHAVRACEQARTVVVVGPRRATGTAVIAAIEDPPGTGPVAAVAAGVAMLPADTVAVIVLAADMPFITAAHIASLRTAMHRHDAAVFVDDAGWPQPLAAIYDAGALQAAMASLATLAHQPARRLLEGMRTVTIPDHGATRDCDTPADLAAAQAAFE